MNKVFKQKLYTMAVDINNKWVDKLGFVEFGIKSSMNASTPKAPFRMVYGLTHEPQSINWMGYIVWMRLSN